MDSNLPKKVSEISLPLPSDNLKRKIILFGLPECPDCLRIKKFFSENALEYEYHDISKDKEAAKWVTSFAEFVPVLVMQDESIMYSPSNEELWEKINGSSVTKTARLVEPHLFDTIIIGAGPAGVTAAIYAVRKALKVLLI